MVNKKYDMPLPSVIKSRETLERGGRSNKCAFANHDHARKKINAARVDICKAFNQLEARGLVRRSISSISGIQ